MKIRRVQLVSLFAALAVAASSAFADVVSINIPSRPTIAPTPIHMGSDTRPDGSRLTVDSISLLLDGKRWMPAMGEFHFARYDKSQWRDELLKMKAGGIDIVSTYVFWIYHEEREGQWDWSGNKSLHDFVALCGELGLKVIVRCGPWDHGECRNGGFPDWLLTKGYRLRSDDPGYLEHVRRLYGQIAGQLKGLLWKEGGPVIGIQLENEFTNGQHLLTLKSIAQQAGIDVPLYTRTGWPGLSRPIAFGELLPFFGCYGDGFWDRSLMPMPGSFWQAYIFSADRLDTATPGDRLRRRFNADLLRYPFLTCELGGGMEPAYHRRILIAPMDVAAVALLKLGSGGQMLGYYMYHGGTHPDAEFSNEHLQETQSAPMTNYNDMPAKNYDFQAPLGQFGEVRGQYHLLRRIHLFMHDFGSDLATMPAYFPSPQASGKADVSTLRWSARSDGSSGYIFVSNYQRLTNMPEKPGTQFDLKLPDGELRVPSEPLTIPANSSFFWPFNMDLSGAKLIYATAQPICRLQFGGVDYTFFAEIPQIPAEFALVPGITVDDFNGSLSRDLNSTRISGVRPGLAAAIRFRDRDGHKHAIVLLDDATSRTCCKARIAGADYVVLSRATVMFDADAIRLRADDPGELSMAIFPSPGRSLANSRADGLFQRVTPALDPAPVVALKYEKVQDFGPLRQIGKAAHRNGVATEPTDADFDQAAVWHIDLPAGIASDQGDLLRIRYVGDVARIYCGGKLLDDDFYNGKPLDFGVDSFGPDVFSRGLDLKILPFQRKAPIYLDDRAKAAFGSKQAIDQVDRIDLVRQYEATIHLD